MLEGFRMADKSIDFYAVLGLKRECTAAELKNAYRRLVLEWHPDRFSASGNPRYVEEATKKFQAIQQAYSVLSDANKKFLYDVGVYDSNDDGDENGMGEFLNEMATMMSQTKSSENRNETFEELQELFDEMFTSDIQAFGSSSRSATPPMCSSSSSCTNNNPYARNSTDMSSLGQSRTDPISHLEGFCMGTGESSSSSSSSSNSNRRKNTRRGRR